MVACACGNVVSYWMPGATALGRVGATSAASTPDASSGAGFVIRASNLDGQRQGLNFYGVDNNGFSPLPWGLTSRFACVKPPPQRLPIGSNGGTAGACDGDLGADFNSSVAVNPAALGDPFQGGEQIYARDWFRIPPSLKLTSLSDAPSFVVCP